MLLSLRSARTHIQTYPVLTKRYSNQCLSNDKDIVTRELRAITECFGELEISRGNKRDLIRIYTLMNRKKRQVEIVMNSCLKEVVEMAKALEKS